MNASSTYGVEVDDAYDWVTAAKNMGKWHLGVERGAQELEGAWRRADKRESGRRHRREAAASKAAHRRILPAHIGCRLSPWRWPCVAPLVCVCISSAARIPFLSFLLSYFYFSCLFSFPLLFFFSFLSLVFLVLFVLHALIYCVVLLDFFCIPSFP